MKQRVIKFKAKRLDNGLWDLLQVSEKDVQIYNKDCGGSDHPVNPSTVCQFTGLKDKEGNPIYEGDIVDFSGEGEVIFKDGAFYVKFSKYMDCLLSTLVYEKPSLMVICSKFDRKEEK